MNCEKCEKALTFDEYGLDRKYNGGKPLCLGCLAQKFGVSEERLKEKIEEFRASGCLMFAKKDT